MRIRLPDGREIQAVNHRTAHLLHLMELKQQTREWTDDGKGLGMRALSVMQRCHLQYQIAVEEEQKAAEDSGRDPQPIDPPDDLEIWMVVVVFLSRRAAGDKVSFAEAADVGIDDVVAIPEPGDQGPGEVQDPPTPGSGGPVTPDAPAAADAQV